METGQMNMIQMPIDVTLMVAPATAVQAQAVAQGELGGSVFAGILLGMTPQEAVQPIPVAGVIPAEVKSLVDGAVTVAPLVAMEMKPEISLNLAAVTPAVKPPVKIAEAVRAGLSEKDAEQQPEDVMPQNVVMSAAGEPVYLVPQIIGRMPESDRNGAVTDDRTDAEAQQDQQPSLKADKIVVENGRPEPETAATKLESTATNGEKPAAPVASDMPVQQITEAYPRTVVPESTTPSSVLPREAVKHPVASGAAEIREHVQAQATPAAVQVATPIEPPPNIQLGVSTTPPQPKEVTTQAAETRQPVQNVSALPIAENAVRSPVMVETSTTTDKEIDSISVAERPTAPVKTQASAVPQIPMQQFMEAYSRPFAAVSKAPSASAATATRSTDGVAAPQAAPQTIAPAPVHASSQVATPVETLAGQFFDKPAPVQMDTTVRNIATSAIQEQGTQKAALMVTASVPEQLQAAAAVPVQRAIENGVVPAQVIAKISDWRPAVKEEHQQQAATTTDTKSVATVENVVAGAVKAIASATTGEESLSSDKQTSDRTAAMGGQIHQAIMQLQTKNETVAAATAPATVGAAGAAEQVVKQVSEHLTRHEIKTGSEQIVLRLSPENLGELKVNLRMENQRLSVEIVTENRMVREALLQNSDTLKESLAKQNIKMDSFDVSTGSNNGSTGRDQNDWRELVRQQQYNAWKADNGYRLPTVVQAQIPPVYQAQSAHSMVDLHY